MSVDALNSEETASKDSSSETNLVELNWTSWIHFQYWKFQFEITKLFETLRSSPQSIFFRKKLKMKISIFQNIIRNIWIYLCSTLSFGRFWWLTVINSTTFFCKKVWLRVAKLQTSCSIARGGPTSKACSPILSPSLTLGLLKRIIRLT